MSTKLLILKANLALAAKDMDFTPGTSDKEMTRYTRTVPYNTHARWSLVMYQSLYNPEIMFIELAYLIDGHVIDSEYILEPHEDITVDLLHSDQLGLAIHKAIVAIRHRLYD